MEEVKILHETAKLAKIKGFNIGNDSDSECYDEDGDVTRAGHLNYSQICYRPTQALLAKWLREKHDMLVGVYSNASGYDWERMDTANLGGTHRANGGFDGPNLSGNWDTYEEALEVGLFEALKLIKVGKDLQVSE